MGWEEIRVSVMLCLIKFLKNEKEREQHMMKLDKQSLNIE